jgi:hypothetical protein
MIKIRIPASKTYQFKSFCKRFSKHFEKISGIRLRGNQLLNIVAKGAGHDSYTALLLDSKTYGNGSFQWDKLPGSLSEPIASSTNTSFEICLNALSKALLEDPDAVNKINGNTSEANSPIKSDNTDRYGHIFSEEVGMTEVISSNPTPVIDLNALQNERTLTETERHSLHKIIIHQYLSLSDEERMKVIFLGFKDAVLELLQSNSTLATELMKNPSIKSHGIELACANADINEFKNASKDEIDSVLSNTRTTMILKDKQDLNHPLSAGELFAGRKRPNEMTGIEDTVKSTVDQIKNNITEVLPGAYDLLTLANEAYFKLPNTSGFTSKDLAGWLLDNGRKIDVALCVVAQT